MSNEVQDVLSQIALIEREIINPETGNPVLAFDTIPYSINANDMPLFINFAGSLNENVVIGYDFEAREFRETRLYTLSLYSSPYGTGIEGEQISRLTPFFPLVYKVFAKYPHLKGLGGVIEAKINSDSGFSTIHYNGTDYFGIRFVLQVTTRNRRILGEDE